MADLEVYSQVVDQIDILELRLNKIQKMFDRADNQVGAYLKLTQLRKMRLTRRRPTTTYRKKTIKREKTCRESNRTFGRVP